jgi:hypothetical protein
MADERLDLTPVSVRRPGGLGDIDDEDLGWQLGLAPAPD